MSRLITYSFILLLCTVADSFAQAVGRTDRFVPYEKVIFFDNEAKELTGSFPEKWEAPPSYRKSGWSVKVMEHPDGNYITVLPISVVNGTISIEPKINALNYLADSFTLEFDFYLETSSSVLDVDFYGSTPDELFKLIFHTVLKKEKKSYLLEYARWYYSNYKEVKKLPSGFTSTAWHHFAISYAHGLLRCYLDDDKLLAVPNHDHPLSGFFFSLASWVDLKNVRLATGGKGEPKSRTDSIAAIRVNTKPVKIEQVNINPLNELLTAKKFTTHAINFDVNKSSIRPESMEFIRQLSGFLMDNPLVSLEINGHTDNDGDAAFNMKLSLARAEEVKRTLIANGIEAGRLITNGFGDTRPIMPNDTPEGKAENRRVEFISL